MAEITKDLQVVSLEVENFKRVRAVRIDPREGLVVIAGRNAQGKSSVLDSIGAALMGLNACPADPIRHGEQSAVIKLDLGEVVVTRKFTPSGSQLTIIGADGVKLNSPQRVLDELLGSLTFDPLAFARMKPRDQFDQLKKAVELPIDLEGLERDRRDAYEKRTGVNTAARTLRAQAEGVTFPEDTPEEVVDPATILDEIRQGMAFNQDIQMQRQGHESLKSRIENSQSRIQRMQAELDAAQAELADLQLKLDEAAPLPEPKDTAALEDKLKNIQAINQAVEARKRKTDLAQRAKVAEQESEALTDLIEKLDQSKERGLAAAKFPVPGLGLGDGQVLFNGVPLEQSSSAEQLRVSTALAMAANPKLKVVLIREGSLLDEGGLLMIAEMAEEHGYQVWIEKVDSSRSMGIVIEDGEVALDLHAAEA